MGLIHKLTNEPNISSIQASLVVQLIYTLTSSGARPMPVQEKLSLVTGIPLEQVIVPEVPFIETNLEPIN